MRAKLGRPRSLMRSTRSGVAPQHSCELDEPDFALYCPEFNSDLASMAPNRKPLPEGACICPHFCKPVNLMKESRISRAR